MNLPPATFDSHSVLSSTRPFSLASGTFVSPCSPVRVFLLVLLPGFIFLLALPTCEHPPQLTSHSCFQLPKTVSGTPCCPSRPLSLLVPVIIQTSWASSGLWGQNRDTLVHPAWNPWLPKDTRTWYCQIFWFVNTVTQQKNIFKGQTGPRDRKFVTQPQTHPQSLPCSCLFHLFLHQFLHAQRPSHMPPVRWNLPWDIGISFIPYIYDWCCPVEMLPNLNLFHGDTCLNALTRYEHEAVGHSCTFFSLTP